MNIPPLDDKKKRRKRRAPMITEHDRKLMAMISSAYDRVPVARIAQPSIVKKPTGFMRYRMKCPFCQRSVEHRHGRKIFL